MVLVVRGQAEHPQIRLELNGEVMQDGSTRDWLFPLPKLLSILSQVMTLEPGDPPRGGQSPARGARD